MTNILGGDCTGAVNKCLRCNPGFYIKDRTADECIKEKEIGKLTSPRYGVDKASALPIIKPCSDPACLSCASDYTHCACKTGQFYYKTSSDPVEDKVCSSMNNVIGYGLSSSPNPHSTLTLLEPCSVSSCQDCKLNNLECRQCSIKHYYKPPSNGVYEGCYQENSLPGGWREREGSYELSPKYLSNQQTQVVKLSSKSRQVVDLIAVITIIVLLLSNFDFNSTIFKIIQLITIFDKLRFMNVTIKSSFGEFIEYIGELFDIGLIQRDDYHLASVSNYNSFERFRLSVISYRTKTDKFIIFWVAVGMRIVMGYLMSTLKDIGETEFLKMEKRGRIIKRMVKISSGMLMMSLPDILFVTGHQILHQKPSTKFYTAEYILSYFVSLIMFCYSCWIISQFIMTMNNEKHIYRGESERHEYQIKKEEERNSNKKLNQIQKTRSTKREISGQREHQKVDESDLHPLDSPPHRNPPGKVSSLVNIIRRRKKSPATLGQTRHQNL